MGAQGNGVTLVPRLTFLLPLDFSSLVTSRKIFFMASAIQEKIIVVLIPCLA